jgi:hypothetical protein
LVEPLSFSHPPDTDSTFSVIDNAVAWSFERLLTPDLLIGLNGGWLHRRGNAFPTQSGFDQSSMTLKGLVHRNDLHETLISASLTWGIGSSGAQGVGANKPNSLIPSITFGKGFGDLPDELSGLRPFAITGAVAVGVPNERGFSRIRW